MALRVILISWITLFSVASLLMCAALVYWHVVHKVDAEMRAAIAVGEHTAYNALHDAEEAVDPLRQLKLLVADLDGDRHLTARLMGANGALLARSTVREPSRAAPRWFFNLLAPPAQVTRIQLPVPLGPVSTIVLATDSRNEIGEIWHDFIFTLTMLGLFCLFNAALVLWVTGRALQPLNSVVRAFERISAGDYSVRVSNQGPLEIETVSSGLNQMVKRLAGMQQRQAQLEKQLLAVQEEERTQIAQDIHDEIGPLLFAVSVDLSAMQNYTTAHPDPQVRARLTATQEAVAEIQRHVKGILERLRPPTIADLGLLHSIERIVGFWSTHYPEVTFKVNVVEEPIASDIAGRIARITHESISNALRHGHPETVEIDVTVDGNGAAAVEIRNDGVGLQAGGPVAGWGLQGIRNQVESAGGTVTIGDGRDGRGVVVSARFPRPGHAV